MAKKRKRNYRKEALDRSDNRPWFDRATNRDFFNPDPGANTLLLTGEPSERINDYGKPVVDIPTNRGVLSTGAYDLLRPLARAYKKYGKVAGVQLHFIATGVKQARRFKEVQVRKGKEVIT